MKKTLVTLLSVILLSACNNNKTEEPQQDTITEENIPLNNSDTEEMIEENSTFDISNIPVSDANLGDFPFFTAPEGAKYINRVKPIDFDFIVFVTSSSIYEVEGKTFRAHVHKDRKSNKEISGRYLIKSYEEAITAAGGVKVFEGKLTKEQLEQYKNLCTYAGSNGSIDVWNNSIATYIIKRNDGNIYIAIEKGKTNTTSIQIVQEKPFEQTIKKVTSDDIAKDLSEKGKAILHINFDTDKATLKPDGLEVINEIVKVLKNDIDLNISINGYTDNTGNKEHNQKLSENRALSVKSEITKAGISADRLTSKGFGAENPIADNSTEEGKTKNRRVELVKL